MGLSKSGGDRVMVELSNRLSALGHDVTILVSKPGVCRTFPLDARIHLQVADRSRNVAAQLLWLARSVPPNAEIVIANYYPTAFSVALARIWRRFAAFYLIQGYESRFFRFEGPSLRKWVRKHSASLSYFLPLRHIYVSRWLCDQVGRREARPVVISNGVDEKSFNPDNRPAGANRTVMFFGHTQRNKGSALVAEAINRVAQKMPVEALVVTQDKNYQPGLECPTHIVSPADDQALADCYRRAGVFVFASWEEGFGLPPLEAMACGTPVVCSRCGGVEDYTVDRSNCLKVEAGDVAAIEAAITALFRAPELGSSLAKNGLITARSLTWDKAAAGYAATFQATVPEREKAS